MVASYNMQVTLAGREGGRRRRRVEQQTGGRVVKNMAKETKCSEIAQLSSFLLFPLLYYPATHPPSHLLVQAQLSTPLGINHTLILQQREGWRGILVRFIGCQPLTTSSFLFRPILSPTILFSPSQRQPDDSTVLVPLTRRVPVSSSCLTPHNPGQQVLFLVR